ncbi:neurofilament heavy polypeptide isoform X1 [Pararge aegeria]|uniref:neurofilament heavy polypeptide isoform X1 n=1 Tax=Pararge aegeria TaxID=116150 RepID=UPI0019D08168|nr:neurofilament heavy polypeptide isoform X1 [Pararge aegeria]
MKIPETSANIGAYYGNEENGQWQPNGAIIDSGVGGGVVGSGDAGLHRPPVYPVHIPRGHIPGYVMAGAYYPPAYPPAPPPPQNDFADYMWMENEEEFDKQDDFEDYMWMENQEDFDKQVMQQLEEEALMEQCIEAMLEDEQREQRQRPVPNGHNHPTTSNGSGTVSLQEAVSRSTLNPLAAEFVPNRARQPPEEKQPVIEVKTEVKTDVKSDVKTDVASAKEVVTEVTQKDMVDGKQDTEAVIQSKKEETIQAPTEPPEVSAAGLLPIDTEKDKRTPKEAKKDTKPKQEVKKAPKVDIKAKAKPIVVKSETKVQPKKEEVSVKVVKSEIKVEKKEVAPVAEVVKQATPPVTEETSLPGLKPINYAAAAKANKPKKPTTPPVTEKTAPQVTKTEKVEKKPMLKDSRAKSEKPSVQRKSSMK